MKLNTKFKGLRYRSENSEQGREEAIKNNLPVLFDIRKDKSLNSGVKLWDELRTFESVGKKSVREHDELIQKNAKKHNLNPDIIRSVMFAENARGHKGGLNKAMDMAKSSDTPLPMNINKNIWSSLVDKKPEDMYDPDVNIEAATILLKRIAERVENPNASKLGSIWQYLGREKTNEFGEYIGKVYQEKPWARFDD